VSVQEQLDRMDSEPRAADEASVERWHREQARAAALACDREPADALAEVVPAELYGDDHDDDQAEGVAALPFVSAAELRAQTPAEPDWCWQSYLAPGILTLLAKPPKAGGSTLAVALAEAVAREADSFLGRAINGGPVVYVSEEPAATLAHKLPAIDTIRVLTRDAARPKPSWAELVAGSIEEALRVGAVLLVVDTMPYWASMAADAEKDAGAAQAAMAPLLDATRAGLAVLVPLHTRKGGGDDGEAVRGSGAIAGTADVVLELGRGKAPRQRVLLALSRFPSTPGALLIERDELGAWSTIGEGERGDARAIGDRRALLAAMADGALTRSELERATDAPERQWHSELVALVGEGKAQRTGAGKKGDPYRWELLRGDSAQAAAQHRAETATADASFSAALPVGEQQKEADRATPTDTARCAENGNEDLPDGWTLAALEAIAAEQQETAA
jgi:hypothetical protein